jgi:hypothetical protein
LDACFVVQDASGHKLGYFYYEEECGCYCGEIKIFAGGEGESDVAGGVDESVAGGEGESDVAGGETQSAVGGGEDDSDGVAVVAALTSMSET